MYPDSNEQESPQFIEPPKPSAFFLPLREKEGPSSSASNGSPLYGEEGPSSSASSGLPLYGEEGPSSSASSGLPLYGEEGPSSSASSGFLGSLDSSPNGTKLWEVLYLTEEKNAFMNKLIQLALQGVESGTENFQLKEGTADFSDFGNSAKPFPEQIRLSLIDKHNNEKTHIELPIHEYTNFSRYINAQVSKLIPGDQNKAEEVKKKVHAEIRNASEDAKKGHSLHSLFEKENTEDTQQLLRLQSLERLSEEDQHKKLLAHVRQETGADDIRGVTINRDPVNGEKIKGKRIFQDAETGIDYFWRTGAQQFTARILAVSRSLIKSVSERDSEGFVVVEIKKKEIMKSMKESMMKRR